MAILGPLALPSPYHTPQGRRSRGLRDAEDERARAEDERGLFALARRTHFLFGVVYLILGGLLVATTFGWNPIGGLFGPRTEVPDKAAAPSKPGSVPIDQLPPAKPETKPSAPSK